MNCVDDLEKHRVGHDWSIKPWLCNKLFEASPFSQAVQAPFYNVCKPVQAVQPVQAPFLPETNFPQIPNDCNKLRDFISHQIFPGSSPVFIVRKPDDCILANSPNPLDQLRRIIC